MLLEAATGNVLLSNNVTGGGDGGVNLIAQSNNNRLESKTSSQNRDAGFNVIDSNDNELLTNTAHNNSDDGILV